MILYGVGKQKTTFLKMEMEKYCNIQRARNKKWVKPDKRILKLQILIHIKKCLFSYMYLTHADDRYSTLAGQNVFLWGGGGQLGRAKPRGVRGKTLENF